MKKLLLTATFIATLVFTNGCANLSVFNAEEELTASIKTSKIRIRDPFILVDKQKKVYYMYAQTANRTGKQNPTEGIEVYRSKDLKTWTEPSLALQLPKDAWGSKSLWAPEVHKYKGKYYMFVTPTSNDLIKKGKNKRGTQIFYSDSPMGPFEEFANKSQTPTDWMTLDGTLYVENYTPYMIFCHEWVQRGVGSMDLVKLKDDLSATTGKITTLFDAHSIKEIDKKLQPNVITDGCFLYKSPKSGKLFMIWSNFVKGRGYCVILAESKSNKIAGPWVQKKLLYTKNGGHGMIFRDLKGQLMLSLHQPNSGAKERLHLFKIEDTANTLNIKEEIKLP